MIYFYVKKGEKKGSQTYKTCCYLYASNAVNIDVNGTLGSRTNCLLNKSKIDKNYFRYEIILSLIDLSGTSQYDEFELNKPRVSLEPSFLVCVAKLATRVLNKIHA